MPTQSKVFLAFSAFLMSSLPACAQEAMPDCFFLECAPGDSTTAPPPVSLPPPTTKSAPSAGPLPRPSSDGEHCTRLDIGTVCTSSVLDPWRDVTYGPDNMFDDQLDTAWVEGVTGDGIGERLTFEFDAMRPVFGISLLNGYHKSNDLYLKNGRIAELQLETSDGGVFTTTLPDDAGWQDLTFDEAMDLKWFSPNHCQRLFRKQIPGHCDFRIQGHPAMITQMDRRTMLLGLAATGSCGCALCSGAQAAEAKLQRIAPRGCTLSRAEADDVAARAMSVKDYAATSFGSTGQAGLDRALDTALVRMATILEVVPGFAFYDDSDGLNAFATPYAGLGREIGSVFYGKGLFELLMQRDPSGGAIMWVAAHEFSHILQFDSGIREHILAGESTVRRLELHADYLAGFYAGKRKREEPRVSLFDAGKQVWSMGDTEYNNPDHHGTPSERLKSSEAGFLLAYEHDVSRDEAFKAGYDYVMQI